MTWVVATASVIFGAMVGDVRVSVQQGGKLVPLPVGLRKVHIFSGRTVCGFAGEIRRAWGALESVNSYMGANGQDDPRLLDQVKGWVNYLYRTRDPLSMGGGKPDGLQGPAARGKIPAVVVSDPVEP